MLKIGLTGGIGSGKSIVARIFQVLGIPVFFADQEARKMMEQDALLSQAIAKQFGASAYSEGKLNRSYLSDIVFNDPLQLDKLNALVHPATLAAADKWMLEQDSPYVIKEAALLFEAGTSTQLDYVVGVHAPLDLRIKRVMDRDGSSREAVIARMSHQIDETVKMKLCDFVIVNDEVNPVIPQVLSLHDKLLALSKVFGVV